MKFTQTEALEKYREIPGHIDATRALIRDLEAEAQDMQRRQRQLANQVAWGTVEPDPPADNRTGERT